MSCAIQDFVTFQVNQGDPVQVFKLQAWRLFDGLRDTVPAVEFAAVVGRMRSLELEKVQLVCEVLRFTHDNIFSRALKSGNSILDALPFHDS